MNKVVAGIGIALGGLALVGVGLVAVVAMQPSHVHLERSVDVAAAPADVFPFANDLDLWMKWNPWDTYEPTSKKAFSETRSGVGAWYTWDGEQLGSGKMTVAASTPDQRVDYDLHFTAPFEAQARVAFTFAPAEAGTHVVWSYDADADFMTKAAGLVMDMDAMLGADFEKGLALLKPLAEAAGQERHAREAAERAAAEAAAQLAAAEAGGL